MCMYVCRTRSHSVIRDVYLHDFQETLLRYIEFAFIDARLNQKFLEECKVCEVNGRSAKKEYQIGKNVLDWQISWTVWFC